MAIDRGGSVAEIGQLRQGQVEIAAAHAGFEHIAADLVLERVGSSLRDRGAFVDHDDAISEMIGLFQVLRCEQDGGASVSELANEVPEFVAASGVQPGGGLVEDQDRCAADQACA